MKTQYYTATSLDGFIATEDDSLDWLFPLGDINDTSYSAFFAEVGALAMGSTTYEWILSHSDKVAEETGSSWPYTQPTWVFSSRKLPSIENADIRFVQGSVAPVHAEMVQAAGGKNLWVVGGGDLAGQFHDAGLLDENPRPGGLGYLGQRQAAVSMPHHQSAAGAGLRPPGGHGLCGAVLQGDLTQN
ncbi:dihydrofolate reductase family protein [Billgrantia antri]|uniref:dihydrofolate reductase family protein n=1 Tax=Billgrantia antri TaxID=2846777 RepID=UPI003B21394C